MVNLTIRKALVSAWLVLMATTAVTSGTLQTRILQYKQDRLYFPAGTEAHIYPHSRFTIMCGADSIYEGCIDESYLGVSYSFPLMQLFDYLPIDSCYASIEVAEIDSVSTITLGLSGISKRFWRDRLVDSSSTDTAVRDSLEPSDSITPHGNEISVLSYPDYYDLAFKVQLGELDGFVSFADHTQELPGDIVIDAPAPFIVAMIPNLSHDVNRGGHLAVSLYYRFNEARLPMLFKGDNLEPIHSFRPSSMNDARPYPFSAQLGRELLEQHQHRPRQVRLWVSDEPLEKLAMFFADVLSRDRVEVRLVDRFEDADVGFTFVHFDEQNDQATLDQVYDIIRATPPEFSFQQEMLDSVSICLSLAAGEPDSTRRAQYLLRADQYLIHDLGVLPLFRPRMYFHASRLLTGYRFSADGRFMLNDVTKLKLPAPGARCSQ